MATLEELLALAKNPGEAGIPDTIYDDMEFAYQDMVAAAAQERDGATAKIQELEGQLSALKAHNYELLMASGNTGDDANSGGDGGSDGEEDESAETISVDDLFG